MAELKLPCLIIWIQNGSDTANRVTMTRWCHQNTDWLWIYLTSWECSVSLSKVVFFWNIWAISRLEVHSRIFECSLQRKHTAVGNKMAILVSAGTILQNTRNFCFYVIIQPLSIQSSTSSQGDGYLSIIFHSMCQYHQQSASHKACVFIIFWQWDLIKQPLV